MPQKLILIRHGQTDWNVQKRYQGQRDIPLNDNGRLQAALLRDKLTAEGVGSVFSSDSVRAYEFAGLVFDGLEVFQIPGLREMGFGELEGLTYNEAIARFGDEYTSWIRDPDAGSLPGAEKFSAFRERVLDAFYKISSGQDADAAAIVTHAGPIRIIAASIMGSADFFGIKPSSGSYSIIEKEGDEWKLGLFNKEISGNG